MKLKQAFRRSVRWLAFAYLGAIVLIAGCLYFVGEGWWVTGVLMYLPQLGWALPLPVVVALIALVRDWRLLWTQLAVLVVWLFVLMGLTLPRPHFSAGAAPKMRILSFNANSCYSGVDTVARQIIAQSADLVLLQELFANDQALADLLRKTYPVVQFDGQFLIASRYPILQSTVPPRVAVGEAMRTARFVHYSIQSPLGTLSVYNMHPLSARGALWTLRKGGFKKQLLQGHALDGEVEESTQGYAQVRVAQAAAAAQMAKADPGTVLIAGDTNLPSFSPALRRLFGPFQDGFIEAGAGFGFTFPDRMPWMRIDRIFASNALKFVDFRVDCRGASDHYCVVAELERREP